MEHGHTEAEQSSIECVQILQRTEGLLAGRLNNRFRPYGLSSATFNVLVVLLGLAPLGIFTLLLAIPFFLFEVGLVATLQAFIFATLTSIYIGGATADEH